MLEYKVYNPNYSKVLIVSFLLSLVSHADLAIATSRIELASANSQIVVATTPEWFCPPRRPRQG